MAPPGSALQEAEKAGVDSGGGAGQFSSSTEGAFFHSPGQRPGNLIHRGLKARNSSKRRASITGFQCSPLYLNPRALPWAIGARAFSALRELFCTRCPPNLDFYFGGDFSRLGAMARPAKRTPRGHRTRLGTHPSRGICPDRGICAEGAPRRVPWLRCRRGQQIHHLPGLFGCGEEGFVTKHRAQVAGIRHGSGDPSAGQVVFARRLCGTSLPLAVSIRFSHAISKAFFGRRLGFSE
jgi:hypothetical protein